MPDAPEDFVKRAKEIYPGSISPEEYEEILQLGSEFVAMKGEHRIFILGSYENVKRNRLEDTEKAVRDYPGASCSAFRMSDILDKDEALNGILKYQLLADYATNIIAVCETDQGGAAIEQGMLAVVPNHLQKTYLCKRTYHSDLEYQRYSWMQTQGVFEIFKGIDQLCDWETPIDLVEEVEGILDEIT